jgi:hypothetical protein
MMIGASARVSEPYHPDVTVWPLTSLVTDVTWGASTPPAEPSIWLATSECGGPDAWDSVLIGLPLSGYIPGVSYYTVSPSQAVYCGAPADGSALRPGEGYWIDVKDLDVWMRLQANQWP